MLRRRNGVQSLRSIYQDGETDTTMMKHKDPVDLTYFIDQLATSINRTQLSLTKRHWRQIKARSLDLSPNPVYGLQRRNAIRIPAGKERPWIFQAHRQEQEELLAKHKLQLCDENMCMYCVLASYQRAFVQGPRDMDDSNETTETSSEEQTSSEDSEWETMVTALSKQRCMLSAKDSVVGICIGVTERIGFWESHTKC